jgi:YVTN family beta-propeller protein
MQFKKNLSSFSALTLTLAALCTSATVLAAPFAYVPNEKSGTLSVIDTENDTVVAEIKAGDKPRGLAVSMDGKTLYVSDQPHNALLKINLEDRSILGSIDLGESRKGCQFLLTASGLRPPQRSVTR